MTLISFQKVDQICNHTHSVVTTSMTFAINKTIALLTEERNNFTESHKDIISLVKRVYLPWFDIIQTSYDNFDSHVIKSIILCKGPMGEIPDRNVKDIADGIRDLKQNINHVWFMLMNVKETAELYNISFDMNLYPFVDFNFCNETLLIRKLEALMEVIKDNNSICSTNFKTQFYDWQTFSQQIWHNSTDKVKNLFQFRETFLSSFFKEVNELKHNIEQVDKGTPQIYVGELHGWLHKRLRMFDYLEKNTINASEYFDDLADIINQGLENVTDFVNHIQKMKSSKLEMIRQDFSQAIDSLEMSKHEYQTTFVKTFSNQEMVTNKESKATERKLSTYISELKDTSEIVSFINSLQTMGDVLETLDDILAGYDKMYLSLKPPVERALEELVDYSNKFKSSLQINFDFVM